MKTTNILCLALCGLALALFQPLTAQAQDPAPYFKNTDGRVTFLVDANPGGNARNERCPVKLGGKTAQLDIPSFKINGQLWDLLGSLVQVYYAKYTLGDRLLIPVTSDNMATMDTMTNAPGGVAFIDIRRKLDGSQTVELTEESVTWHPTLGVQNHYVLKVPSDLFDKIAISSVFHMEINFERGGSGCRVSRGYAGILGKAGDWGWDVPGSPEWEKAFADMNHDQATNYWQTLKTENHNVYAKVSDLSIYLGDFMAALGSDNPEIADKLSTALGGYPQNILTDQPEAGLADLQKAAGDMVEAWASGKQITDDLRTAATHAAAQALNGSPKMKEMAERLQQVLVISTPKQLEPFQFSMRYASDEHKFSITSSKSEGKWFISIITINWSQTQFKIENCPVGKIAGFSVDIEGTLNVRFKTTEPFNYIVNGNEQNRLNIYADNILHSGYIDGLSIIYCNDATASREKDSACLIRLVGELNTWIESASKDSN